MSWALTRTLSPLPADAAFQHVARVERLADLAHVARLALVLERRVARDDDEARRPSTGR